MDTTLEEMEPFALKQTTAFANWFIAAVNYSSFNIADGAGMSIVMGGSEKNTKVATIRGLLVGIGSGLLFLLSHLALYSRVVVVCNYDLPILKIFDEISPILSNLMSLVLFGMIFNTGVSMFYSFVARFFDVENKRKTYPVIILTCVIGFILSFVGFTKLVE